MRNSVAPLIAAVLFVVSGVASAKGAGIAGYSGNPATNGGQTCNKCHDGGAAPSVSLTGPNMVASGSRSTLTFWVGGGQRAAAGMNVSATGGTLIATQSGTGLSGAELVQTTPLSVDAQGNATFSFDWTAPTAAGTYVLYASGNSIDLNGRTSGDMDGATTLAVLVQAPASNQPPVAVANGPYSGTAGTAVQLSSAGSSDPDGSIASFLWDFGDGSTSTAANPAHTYAAAGSYVVTLRVTDNLGATGTDQTTASIASSPSNQAPVANANGPYSGLIRKAVQMSSAGSYDPDGTITAYTWNFGDGSSSTAANPKHAYRSIGTFTVTLTVTDNGGATATHQTTATITK